jgi:hypothetical protein
MALKMGYTNGVIRSRIAVQYDISMYQRLSDTDLIGHKNKEMPYAWMDLQEPVVT